MPKTSENDGPTNLTSALDWLRSKTDVDEGTVASFKKIDSVLAKAKSKTKTKAKSKTASNSDKMSLVGVELLDPKRDSTRLF